jgi:hypothetical protein
MRRQRMDININPPKGLRSDFIKVSITLPPNIYGRLAEEGMKRRMKRQPNASMSAMVREAIMCFLDRKDIRKKSGPAAA